MKIYSSEVVGFRRGLSKTNKPFCVAYVSYKADGVAGEAVASVFVPEPRGRALSVGDGIDIAVSYVDGHPYVQYLDV